MNWVSVDTLPQTEVVPGNPSLSNSADVLATDGEHVFSAFLQQYTHNPEGYAPIWRLCGGYDRDLFNITHWCNHPTLPKGIER